ncbi:arginyl-tRNA synthetase [Verrucomicrobium sp. GAS474]|uniref:arginine--tRNA ligase n=1 Tax=Verrucomicrobium sp. GAS474 TaxID=1882831 RepID=UPI0008794909|nr:arginine--tRNA ligase [Verrucomicrobium sp. GAS474]SDT97873.1 arginyl-tRNA synthetase [Verrucomicrobium sp. GAS474]
MKSPQQVLEARLAAASLQLFGSAEVQVKPCADAKHGDFQTNAAMIRAKELGKNPRELAAELAALLPEDEAFAAPVIAGPGFLNFTLKAGWLNRALATARAEGKIGVEAAASASGPVILDFSGPNVAKEMHVGHIRSTILGEALARCHRFLGHAVVTDNHLGDWGTQFGKILLGYKRHGNEADLAERPIEHLEELYQQIHEASKTDEAIQEEARGELLALQQGDAESLALWKRFVAATLAELDKIYGRLGVRFDETLGESAYNDRLEATVKELEKKGIARESEGAIAVFFDESDDKQLTDKPFLIRKSDEAFLYATTDLATVAYRVERWKPARIIYVTDGRQQLHFQQLFATVRKWGVDRVVPTALEHVWFGAILGGDKKPIKTREGKPIKLRALLDEAESRAFDIITGKRPELSEERRREIANVVGLGALKFADLGQNRNLDYVFDWNKLLAFDGNTAPYLQNGYVRIKSIFRKAVGEGIAIPGDDAQIDLQEEAEIALGKKLLALGETVRIVVAESRPHYLCIYLCELATAFHAFYEACPVLKAGVPEDVRTSRLALCALTAEALQLGLELLGIGVVEEM